MCFLQDCECADLVVFVEALSEWEWWFLSFLAVLSLVSGGSGWCLACVGHP